MKQVTGSNPSQSAKNVSIRLVPGGHSFSQAQLPADAEQVEVVLLGAKALLVPQEVATSDGLEQIRENDTLSQGLFAANGTPLAPGECAVWCTGADGMLAVAAAEKGAVQALRTAYAERLSFTTPLLYTPQGTAPTAWMYYAEGYLYIKIYDSGLLFAEVFAAPTEADAVYITEMLGREFSLSKFELHLSAQNPKSLAKLIGGRFRKSLRTTIE